MTHFDEEVLSVVMSRTQAWEELHDRNTASQMNTVDFYNLMIRAGYSEEVAQKAANERGLNRLKAGLNV